MSGKWGGEWGREGVVWLGEGGVGSGGGEGEGEMGWGHSGVVRW